MVLLDARERGALKDIWTSIKDAAAANPDVPTVLLLVAQDVDALSACAILTASPQPARPLNDAPRPAARVPL